MRTKVVKSLMAPLLFASALVTLVASERAPREGGRSGRIQGTWETQITLNDCAGHVIRSFQGMLTFHQGGTMMDGTTTPSAFRTPAEGVWGITADNTYAFRMKSFSFNAQNILTGWGIISGELTVDETGNVFTGTGATLQVYDPNGVLVTTLCAESSGTRFEL